MARSYEALEARGGAIRLALGLAQQPGGFEFAELILPTVDAREAGIEEPRARVAAYTFDTTAMPAVPYDGRVVFGPVAGFAVRVLRAQAWVVDGAAPPADVFTDGRVLTNGVFVLERVAPQRISAAAAQTGAELEALDTAPAAPAPVIDNDGIGPEGFRLASLAGVATRLTIEPRGGIVLTRPKGVDPSQDVLGRIAYNWRRTPGAGDIDHAKLVIHYHAIPLEGYPPL